MNIGIIDADLLDNGTRHPNIALEKISGYHKGKDHNVTLLHNYNNIKDYDEVYLSKVFDFTKIPIDISQYDNLFCGGTGLYWTEAPNLPDEIEHHMPDYNLYNEYIQKEIERGIKPNKFKDYYDYSIGFTCYDKETEVLTQNGWKLFKDITYNDILTTLNPITKEIEYQKPNDIIKVPYNGDLLYFKNKYTDLLVTPNHNMYCSISNKEYKLIRADEISKYYQYKFKKDAIWNGKYIEYFDLPLIKKTTSNIIKNKILMNDWLEFLGYYLSEGSCYFKEKTNSYIVNISQKKICRKSKHKGDVYNKIKNCIIRLGYNYYENENSGFSISNKQLYNYLIQFGLQHKRFIPSFIKELSPDQINIFIDAYVLGDGVLYKRKDNIFTKGIYSCSKIIIDDFQELFLKIGHCGDIKSYTKKGDIKYLKEREIKANYDIYTIFINTYYKQPLFSKQSSEVKKIKYNDYVYCCEVPNHILYVRRNGIAMWCGNTKGCFRKCYFCVNKKYDHAFRHAFVKEFYDPLRKYIYLWDDNIFAYNKWHEVFDELAEINKPFQFRQGLDIRLMTEEKAKVLTQSKWKGDFIFAFDDIKDKELIINKLTLWKKYNNKTTKLYVFCGYNTDVNDIVSVFKRIGILMIFGCLSYIMRHENYEKSKYKGMYINLARWCNQPSFYKKKSFREFCELNGEKSSTMRYLREFEKEHPEIAKQYFDMKFENLINGYKIILNY
jgi:hypothetical protein